jgi:hypothetical protein
VWQAQVVSYENRGFGVSNKHVLKLLKAYARQIQQKILFSLSVNNTAKIDPIKING